MKRSTIKALFVKNDKENSGVLEDITKRSLDAHII